MTPLSSIEIKLCQSQAKIFEASVNNTEYSSLIFIRRFMYSTIAKSMDDKMYLYQSITLDDTFYMLDEEFGKSKYGKIKYSEDEMYWIGYVYRCICIKYNLSSKYVFSILNADEIVKYYNICHTFDIVDAAERIMESINYDNSTIQEKAYKIMKRLMIVDKLENYIGKQVKVTIDKQIGENHNDIVFELNYGHINLNNKIVEAYVLDKKIPLKTYEGVIIGILERINTDKCILLIANNTKNFTKENIRKLLNFNEKKFKTRITLE